MSSRPASIRERESKKLIAVAKKAGAKEVEFRYDGVTAIVRLTDSTIPPANEDEPIDL